MLLANVLGADMAVPGRMQERKIAADSLRKLAAVLSDAAPAIVDALAGCTNIPDQHAPEVFFQTVKAASDVMLSPSPMALCMYVRITSL